MVESPFLWDEQAEKHGNYRQPKAYDDAVLPILQEPHVVDASATHRAAHKIDGGHRHGGIEEQKEVDRADNSAKYYHQQRYSYHRPAG